jgi:hypothetical protein
MICPDNLSCPVTNGLEQIIITPVDLPLKQGSGIETQHAVLFAGVTTQLSAEAVELVTGILPESVENCEQGLVVNLKSQEEHDKMLELSGYIMLKQGKVRVISYSFPTMQEE